MTDPDPTGGRPEITIDDVTHGGGDPFAALSDILKSYNAEHGAPFDWVPMWLFARDASGQVCGGLRGNTGWSWCFVDTLAIAAGYRRTGLGSRLLRQAETIARERNCIGMYLWTTSFQAAPFYEKHGYTAFGHLPDLPPGRASTWYMKRL